MPIKLSKAGHLEVGDYFESCSFHPCVVSTIDDSGVQIEGISLVDGTTHCCNIRHCGLRALSKREAETWKDAGPEDVELPLNDRWWQVL
ncbi:hypothetical protein [Massilia sp.]|uniref:hypothetical protein n=1 Tax=Massilia sp. TaxID=1882437 RepID=UPI00352D2F99